MKKEKSKEFHDASTIEQFLVLPLNERYSKIWYIPPYALQCGEWKKWNEWVKTNHPIQYFFRETVYDFFYYKIKHLNRYFYELKCKFWYKYNIIKLPIGPEWHDTDTLIEQSLFYLFCQYVENEMENICWDEEKELENKILTIYHYIKIDRPELEKQIDNSLEKGYSCDIEDILGSLQKQPTEEQVSHRNKLNELEKQLNEKDDYFLKEIVSIRKSLWS